MTCQQAILSEQTYDYLTDFPVDGSEIAPVLCTEQINDRFQVIYVDNGSLPSLETDFYEYQGIPKLYGLMQIEGDEPIFPPTQAPLPFDPAALIASGISQVQGPPLNLTGFGTLICLIDTGIDYRSPLFRDELGNTRIEAIWDQTDQTGAPPEGFLYGSEYTREQINLALRSANPFEVVPSEDEVGHGTALASVAAGSVAGLGAESVLAGGIARFDAESTLAGSATGFGAEGTLAGSATGFGAASTLDGNAATDTFRRIPQGFRGAAPEAGIVVVKLKPAKEYLKNYYLLPSEALAYQENDVMLAVKYCEGFVRLFQRPVVICLGIGTSMGNHSGTSPLSAYLNQVALKRNCAVIVCGGNEGNGAGHFRGNLAAPAENGTLAALNSAGNAMATAASSARSVEIRVAEGNGGFYMELWGRRTNVLNVEIRSPGGEVIPPIPLGLRQSITFSFVYERTRVTIYSTLIEPNSGEELIFFRFVEPTPGIWTIRVIGQSDGTGDVQGGVFDLWLPLLQFQQAPVYFLSPQPDVTLTEPAMASEVIAVSAYHPANASFYIESGRGFSRNGLPRPDICAPGVDVSTIYGKQSGSGFAAALTAGAVAQLMQWAVVEGNNIFADSRVVKGYLIRGAKRQPDLSYPNKEWGYGRLDLDGTFTSLRT